jgi:hypothetical protein
MGKKTEEALSAWDVREEDFPALGTPEEKLTFLLRYAVLAPSSRNTQPWAFRVEGDAVDIYADRERILPVADPEGREMVISCGAALFNLRTAIRNFGYIATFETLPNTREPDLLVRVHLGVKGKPKLEDHPFFQTITKRHTDRLPFEDRELPNPLISKLKASAEAEDAWLRILTEETRDTVTEMVEEATLTQWSDKRFRRQLSRWLRTDRTKKPDGISFHDMGLEAKGSYLAPYFVSMSDKGKEQGEKDRLLASGAPVLAVLGTDKDEPFDWLLAGQALQRVLLLARSEDLSASFLNQPVEVPGLRDRLRELLSTRGYPQVIIRMGYGRNARPTPRRKMEYVIQETTKQQTVR